MTDMDGDALPPSLDVPGAPRAPSALDDWEGWPENCRNRDLIHGPEDAREVRQTFCPDSDCLECNREEVSLRPCLPPVY